MGLNNIVWSTGNKIGQKSMKKCTDCLSITEVMLKTELNTMIYTFNQSTELMRSCT